MKGKNQLIIVSNRLPVTVKITDKDRIESVRSAGGLVSGLREIHDREKCLWLGYSGVPVDHPRYEDVHRYLATQKFISVPFSTKLYDVYYNKVANGVLWPLFHYFPTHMQYQADEWKSYKEANQLVADTILNVAEDGDRVWIHDYQLMLVPRMLKLRNPRLRVAYFHHIPFPSSEIFRILPARQEVLEGLLGADLIGFHTFDYTRHFCTGVTRLLGGENHHDQITFNGHSSKIGAFPLGLDIEWTKRNIEQPEQVPGMAELAASVVGKQVFLGVDRLDVTKGIPERLQAYSLLLRRHPEWIGNVAFVQVCVPSRQDAPHYAALRQTIEQIVGQINGEFGRPGYVPLQYLFQPFSPEQVLGFYRIGNIALVTPLRDGLNLVCKEYVASRTHDDGVLILSEFAGASAEMGEALLVNPYDIDGMAEAMFKALNMPLEEQKRRMSQLRHRINSYNNMEWCRDFMKSWEETCRAKVRRSRRSPDDILAQLKHHFSAEQHKRIFLDYDGTLVPIKGHPSLAVPDTELKKFLLPLATRSDVTTTIITGRPRIFCDQFLATYDVTLVAEHGAFIRRRGSKDWECRVDLLEFGEVRKNVMPHLQNFSQRVPGSFIEEKEASMVLHYRNAESQFAGQQALELKESLSHFLTSSAYCVANAKKALEIKPATINKGKIIEEFLQEADTNTPFLTAGDDICDEDMFKVRTEHNFSIYIGKRANVARFNLESPASLRALLASFIFHQEIAQHFYKSASARQSFSSLNL